MINFFPKEMGELTHQIGRNFMGIKNDDAAPGKV